LSRYAQIWDATTQSIITTLNFESSSVLDLSWHPQGDRLSLSGNQSIKTWQRQDWDDDPTVRDIGGASGAIAWSPDGTYLASGNNDRSVLVWEEDIPYPWQMQGFPDKVRTHFSSPPLRQMALRRPRMSNRASSALLFSSSKMGAIATQQQCKPANCVQGRQNASFRFETVQAQS